MNARAVSSSAGFSLLEMLVAMTLLAMIGAAAVSGLRFGSRAWERGAESGETVIESRAAQKFLQALLSGARLIRRRDGSRTPPALFDGQADSLELAAPLPARLAPAGEHWIRLSTERRDRETALTLRWTRLGAAPPAIDADAQPEVLLSGVTAVAFRYFGADPETGERSWRDEWRRRATLPELIEARVRWPENDPRVWPPVVARLEVGGQP